MGSVVTWAMYIKFWIICHFSSNSFA